MQLLLLSLYFSLASIFHVGHMAEHRYSYDGKYLNLEFVIEKAELMNFGLGDDCDLSKSMALCTACLLYTSPSPRDGLLSRMPSSA